MSRAAARTALLAACAFASLYALLCWLPFTWANFVRNRAFPSWVGAVVDHSPWLLAAALALAAAPLKGRARAAWAAIAAALAAAAFAFGGLAALEPGQRALALAFAALAPYLAWEALLGRGEDGEAEPAPGPALAPLAAALLCAAAGWLGRLAAAGVPPAGERAAEALALGRSALVHAALFFAAALLADSARALPERARRAAAPLAAWLAATLVVRVWVLDALAFSGPLAWAYAAALGGALALGAARAGVTSLPRAAAASLPRLAAASAALLATPAAAHLALRGSDWNRLLETIVTLAVWGFAYALYSARPGGEDPARRARTRLIAGAAALGLAWGAEGATRLLDGALRARLVLAPEGARLLADHDASFAAARRLLGGAARDDFFAWQRRHTGLPAGTAVAGGAAFTDGAPALPAGAAPPPHVFIVVVDSLRADRLGAYGSTAGLTPALDAFAREADAFRGFTPYGGTALSEPALWAGAFLPHLQYPRPFAPHNALETLIDGLGYRALVTWDTILERILDPAKQDLALDRGETGNYKLCATLAELEGRLDAELASGQPLFVYTQPQDLHISVLAKERAAYDERVKAVDACLGKMFESLKSRGLYDRSVVVIAADHGDSLGEGGRWGHAYTLYPEILRVPLLVRLPPSLRAGLVADLEAPAFLQDLAPSLYAALGLAPRALPEPHGRALYAKTREELEATRRAERLVASSYGPVWGVLGGGGDWLYLSDAVEFKSRWYDLKADPAGARDLIDPVKEARGRDALRRLVGSLQEHYRY